MEVVIEDILKITLNDDKTLISVSTNVSYVELLHYLAQLEAPSLKKQQNNQRVKKTIRVTPSRGEPFETTGILAHVTPPTAKAFIVLDINDIELAPVGSRLEFRYELIEADI